MKKFLKSKTAKRFYWTTLDGFIGLLIAYLGYEAGLNMQWAITILPFATALSNLTTKEINNKIQGK